MHYFFENADLFMEMTSSLYLTASQQFGFIVHYCWHLTVNLNPGAVCLLPHGAAEHFQRGSQRWSNLQQTAELYRKLLEKNLI